MSFAHPALAAAALLTLVAALAAEVLLRVREREFVHPNLAFLSLALRSPAWLRTGLGVACAVAVAAIVLAAAGPRSRTAQGQAATLVLCIDTSGSMNSSDVKPTRAKAAVLAVRQFAAALPPQTRIAIVDFSGVAVTHLAPTSGRRALEHALETLPEPNGQTAIGDALLRAATLLPPGGSRGVLVLTDGKNNRGTDPNFASNVLSAQHVAVEIVRVGPGNDLLARMRAFAARMDRARTTRDWAQPFAFGGLALLAAAWLTRERGAFRL